VRTALHFQKQMSQYGYGVDAGCACGYRATSGRVEAAASAAVPAPKPAIGIAGAKCDS
jgi:hypothetical protein